MCASLKFVFDFSAENRVVAFDYALGDVCFVSVLYDSVKILFRRVNVVVVCSLEVLYVSFYYGGEGVPVSSVDCRRSRIPVVVVTASEVFLEQPSS